MILILFFSLCFVLCATGNSDTDCDASEMGKLICKFSTNMKSTQTDFYVYFHADSGHQELLVDCVWVDDELQCLAQEGFECKQPVSQIAEISLPPRFVDRPGTYICVSGLGHGKVKPCRVGKGHQETQQETKQEYFKSEHDNYLDDKAANSFGVVLGSILGIIAVASIIWALILVYKTNKEKSESKLKPGEKRISSNKSKSLSTLNIPKDVKPNRTL